MDCLESLANTNCFGVLQEKLNTWKYEFQLNKPESNIGRCCELLELNAKIQSQLFKLLGLCAIYGGLKGSDLKMKKHLELYVGNDYFQNGLTTDIVMDILKDIGEKPKIKENYLKSRKNGYSNSNPEFNSFQPNENKVQRSINEGIDKRLNELENVIVELSQKNKPESTNKTLTKKKKYKRRGPIRSRSLPDYSDSFSDTKNDHFPSHVSDPLPMATNASAVQTSSHGDFSGSDVEEIRNDSYLQQLVARYNDLFSESRIQAMDVIRQYNDDHENNQRIIFALVMTTARCIVDLQRTLSNAYGPHKGSGQNKQYREVIQRTHLKSLKARIIYEMIHKKGRYFRFHLPPGFTFNEMEGFIDRLISLFWNFGGTVNGMSLLEAADGELFDEHKYRRSYDSDYVAPLVSHHIWPSLLQGNQVLVKGEACTRSSSKLNSNRSFYSIMNSSKN